MKQRRPWEAESRLGSRKIPQVLWDTNILCHMYTELQAF